MAIVWSAQLPQSPGFGWQAVPGENTLRTEMEVGPAKQRRRATSSPETLVLPFVMTRTQVETLVDFYHEDTLEGSLAFEFPHPLSGTLRSCRFVHPDPFSYSQVHAENAYNVQVRLEVLPDGT